MVYDGFVIDTVGNIVNSWDEATEYPHIIMQFTGLKDKNGKDIYEGDIIGTDCALGGLFKTVIKHGEYQLAIPQFVFDKLNEMGMVNDLNIFAYGWHKETLFPITDDWYGIENKKMTMELDISCYDSVIGNIYENPELMENK